MLAHPLSIASYGEKHSPHSSERQAKTINAKNARNINASGQRDDGVLRRDIGPAKWNLALAALLIEEAHSVLATVIFLSEGFKLTDQCAGERDA
jgi:hypothetical protein